MDTLPSAPSSETRSADRPRSSSSRTEQWKVTAGSEPELNRMHSGTPIQCQFCVGQTFRRSRLRGADIPNLLLMRYPVRCTRCAQRQTVSFTVAGISAPSYLRRRDSPNPAKRSPSDSHR